MPSQSLTITWAQGSDSLPTVEQYTADTVINGDYPIAPGAINAQILFAVKNADIVLLEMVADGALTIKTNSTTVPGDTITMVANKPVLFRQGQWPVALFTADVTSLYANNASGQTVTLKLRGLRDGTV